jgi:hypothetical protein
MTKVETLRPVTPSSKITPVGILSTLVLPTVVPSGKIDARFSILNASIVVVCYSSNYPTFDKSVSRQKRATGVTDLLQVTDLSQIHFAAREKDRGSGADGQRGLPGRQGTQSQESCDSFWRPKKYTLSNSCP